MFTPKRRRLSQEQLNIVGEKIMEWGNFVFIGFVVAQVVPGPLTNLWIVLLGFVLIVIAYWVATTLIMKGGGR